MGASCSCLSAESTTAPQPTSTAGVLDVPSSTPSTLVTPISTGQRKAHRGKSALGAFFKRRRSADVGLPLDHNLTPQEHTKEEQYNTEPASEPAVPTPTTLPLTAEPPPLVMRCSNLRHTEAQSQADFQVTRAGSHISDESANDTNELFGLNMTQPLGGIIPAEPSSLLQIQADELRPKCDGSAGSVRGAAATPPSIQPPHTLQQPACAIPLTEDSLQLLDANGSIPSGGSILPAPRLPETRKPELEVQPENERRIPTLQPALSDLRPVGASVDYWELTAYSDDDGTPLSALLGESDEPLDERVPLFSRSDLENWEQAQVG